jgi:hypothetical protein
MPIIPGFSPAASLDYLVGAGQEQGRDLKPDGLFPLQVDRQPRPVDGLDGEIARGAAGENAGRWWSPMTTRAMRL